MERKETGSTTRFAAIAPRGVKHNSHWLNSEDGESEEIINLRYNAGSWQDIKDKQEAWTYTHGCDLIHYHPLNETESSTGDDTTFFYIGYKPGNGTSKQFDSGDINLYQTYSTVTISSHGLGSVGELVCLKFTEGSSNVPGLTDGEMYNFVVVDASTLRFKDVRLSSAGSGSNHSFTSVNAVVAFLPDESYMKIILGIGTEQISSFNHLNNILVCYTSTSVYYLIWDYDEMEYKRLDTPHLPIMSLRYEESDGDAFEAVIKERTDITERIEGFSAEEILNYGLETADMFSQTLDFLNNKKKENAVVESYVMVCVAYRMFDGSYIMHSQPLMTYIGKKAANLWFRADEDDVNDHKAQYVDKNNGYKNIYSGKPILIIDTSNLTSLDSNWEGLIMGLTVFMVKPWSFYTYPQSAKGYNWKAYHRDGFAAYSDDQEATYYLPQSQGLKDIIDDPIYYRVKEVAWDKLWRESYIEEELGFNLDDTNKESAFYLPNDSFSHHRLLADKHYMFNRRLHMGNVTTKFSDLDTQLISDRYFDLTEEGSGFSFIHQNLYGHTYFTEVTIKTDIGKKYIINEFSPSIFQVPEGGGRNIGESGSGSSSVSGSGSGSASWNEEDPPNRELQDQGYCMAVMPIVSYPDPRASKIRILAKDGWDGKYYEVADYELKAHPFLSIAYCATNFSELQNAWTTQGEEDPGYMDYQHDLVPIPEELHRLYAETLPETESRLYRDENRLAVSRIDNPFQVEAKHNYQIGGQDAVILGLATSAVQVSDGQFGEFPLFVLTNEGVYTMRQGVDPSILYSAISPVSKERMIPGTLCEINSGIIYATADGIKLLSGTNIKDLSEDILFQAPNPLLYNQDFRDLIDGTELSLVDFSTMIGHDDIKTYITGVKIAYDSYNAEIILCNPAYTYSWVYSIKYNTWTRIDQVWDDFMLIHPTYYGLKDNTLYNMEAEQGCTKQFFLQTRPLKLGGQGYKNLSRVVVRQHLKVMPDIVSTSQSGGGNRGGVSLVEGDEIEGVYVYGSVDGNEYKLLRGVKVQLKENESGDILPVMRVVVGGSHASIRYAIIVVTGVFKSTNYMYNSMRLSHIEVSYADNIHNKLR